MKTKLFFTSIFCFLTLAMSAQTVSSKSYENNQTKAVVKDHLEGYREEIKRQIKGVESSVFSTNTEDDFVLAWVYNQPGGTISEAKVRYQFADDKVTTTLYDVSLTTTEGNKHGISANEKDQELIQFYNSMINLFQQSFYVYLDIYND